MWASPQRDSPHSAAIWRPTRRWTMPTTATRTAITTRYMRNSALWPRNEAGRATPMYTRVKARTAQTAGERRGSPARAVAAGSPLSSSGRVFREESDIYGLASASGKCSTLATQSSRTVTAIRSPGSLGGYPGVTRFRPTRRFRGHPDPSFARGYIASIDRRVPLVCGACFLLRLIPVPGVIPGVIVYRQALVAPFRRYLPPGHGLVLRWGGRLVILTPGRFAVGAGSRPAGRAGDGPDHLRGQPQRPPEADPGGVRISDPDDVSLPSNAPIAPPGRVARRSPRSSASPGGPRLAAGSCRIPPGNQARGDSTMETLIAELTAKVGLDRGTAEKVVGYLKDNAHRLPELLQSDAAKGVMEKLPGGLGGMF